jgi:hypothetical protein
VYGKESGEERVTVWEGGEPTLRGDEHTDLCWFKPAVAITLSDLSLEEYRLLLGMISG